MTLHKMPLFVWAMLFQSVIIILAVPVLAGEFFTACSKSNYMLGLLLFSVYQQVSLLHSCSNYLNDNTLEENIPQWFPGYLAGIIEGDGAISVPKGVRSPAGKLYYPSITISFHIKDEPLARFIRSVVGHGSVSVKQTTNVCIYTVNNLEGVVKVVNMINGLLRTGKIVALNNLIAHLNSRAQLDLQVRPLDLSPIKCNAWLAGFIDADGSFQVRTSLTSKYPRIANSFELTQSAENNYNSSNEKIMTIIADFLSSSVEQRFDRKNPELRVRGSSLVSVTTLRDYLETHPLKSSKLLDYKDWCTIHNYVKGGTSLSNVDTILAIKSGMNSKRTVFNWDHLA
jgi:hypothetical protein